MTKYSPIVVHVPADFTPRFASVFEATTAINAPGIKPRRSITLPAAELPERLRDCLGGYRRGGGWTPGVKPYPRYPGRDPKWVGPPVATCHASASAAPVVVPGEGAYEQMRELQWMQMELAAANLPRDRLFSAPMELEVLVTPWEYRTPFAEGLSLSLTAVRLLGDFSENSPARRQFRETIKALDDARESNAFKEEEE